MKTLRHRKVTAGFTLLEVLISIVVVAFGLLGLAGLQLFSIKNNQSASQRIIATSLANDIIDRMKSNFKGVTAGNYNQSGLAAYAPPGIPGCNQLAGCTTAEMAANDLIEWSQRVAAALPGGIGIICVDSTPDDGPLAIPPPGDPRCDNLGNTLYAVKIWWFEDRTRTFNAATRKYLHTGFNP